MSQSPNPLSDQEDKRSKRNLLIMRGSAVLIFIIEIVNLIYINNIYTKVISNSIRLNSVGIFLEVQLIIDSFLMVLVMLIVNIAEKFAEKAMGSRKAN
ncbi:hypothetical protein AVU39_gp37 [Sulfolobus monocaudavirus SMV2]|jgi:hypothetical protein|uniref:hypothetical protein n=1 Tax=Sulfolobus monocaudavirus SMV2 TaxID=1580591 RepID=UPI0006D30A27|nr:hypothetical protein AVU39_gp37 [Sulfolobus monocaudavirus SMV2]AIZ11371.1 hypothetical protein [Sulfolobus monocaudavirus SMV2]